MEQAARAQGSGRAWLVPTSSKAVLHDGRGASISERSRELGSLVWPVVMSSPSHFNKEKAEIFDACKRMYVAYLNYEAS